MTTKHTIIAALAGLLTLGAVQDAAAQRRTNDLAKDVAVRHRRLLVKNRLEFTPLFESTVNADFQHIIGGGAKLEYHLSDMISIGGIGVFSVALKTSLVEKITKTLEATPNADTREPSTAEFESRLNTIPLHGAVYASLTPWYGKLAAFSQAFVAFDFYFQGGLAFAQLKSDCPTNICSDENTDIPEPDGTLPDMNPNNDLPLNSGQRLGLYLGGGIHVFLNDFIALDLTVRDYAFTDNPSGADFDAKDQAVTKNDNRFVHHLFFGAGLSIMFPMKVKRTP
jgi:outer membrane beta-barrel protein